MALSGIQDSQAEKRDWLKSRLSPKRYAHSLGVSQTARILAERFGADPEAAALAGLLHDVAREFSAGALLEEAEALGLSVGYVERLAPMACFHGVVGAELAGRELAVDDEGVLQAIASHTLGRERMSLLEKVVFLADTIEPTRGAAPYLDELRALAEQDLDLACRRAYDLTFEYLIRTGQPLLPQAVCARNWLLYKEKEKRAHDA